MTDEEYVRARWERVLVCDGFYLHYTNGTILLNWPNHQFYEFKDFSAARAFTENRERDIAEIQEEVAWLTKESSQKALHAESRRSCVRNSENLSDEDRKIAHKLAEQMSGRRMPKQSEKQEAQNNAAELRIAAKLDAETIILQRILAVEQARLAELRRGMKEGSE